MKKEKKSLERALIKISIPLKQELTDLGKKGETYEEIIQKLLDNYKKKK